MEGKTCYFIGQREAPDSLLPILDAEVKRHITEYSVTDFVVGKHGRFDGMAAHYIKAAKGSFAVSLLVKTTQKWHFLC